MIASGHHRVPRASVAPAIGFFPDPSAGCVSSSIRSGRARPFSSGRLTLAAAAALGFTAALASLNPAPRRPRPHHPQGSPHRPRVSPAKNEAALKDSAEVLAAVRDPATSRTPTSRSCATGALKGLIDALHDPHSEYLDPKQAAGLTRQIQGSFTGIGALLEMKGKRPAVRGTLPDSPAFKAGLKAGDVIAEVDGKTTEGLEMGETVRRIIGAAGTPVSLTVEAADGNAEDAHDHPGGDPDRVDPRVCADENNRWNYLLDPKHKIGYAHVSQFSPTTHKELIGALEGLKGQEVRGLILDLRDCPGGLLDAAVACVKLFLAKGKIVSIRGRGQPEQTFEADGNAVPARPAARRPDQWPDGLGRRDRLGRLQGQRPGRPGRHPDVRQGLGPVDHHTQGRSRADQADDRLLLPARRP